MRLATWNINSLRVRMDRVLAFLERHDIGVLCLQETKVEDEKFPLEAFQVRGYKVARFGQKSYNGVAILSRFPMTDVERGFLRDPVPEQARVISATIAGIRVHNGYFVNGQAVGSEAYDRKLAWMQALADHTRPDRPSVLVGDFNVTPDDRDVWAPEQWAGGILCSEPERAALRRFIDHGYLDVLREQTDERGIHTWWDYRGGGFAQDQGLRIDLILADGDTAAAAGKVWVDRDERKQGEHASKPSDHAPVIVDIEVDDEPPRTPVGLAAYG